MLDIVYVWGMVTCFTYAQKFGAKSTLRYLPFILLRNNLSPPKSTGFSCHTDVIREKWSVKEMLWTHSFMEALLGIETCPLLGDKHVEVLWAFQVSAPIYLIPGSSTYRVMGPGQAVRKAGL